MMKSSLFDKINPNILPILKNTESPTRVIAAPGSGKTETITLKYLYLITECGVDPSNILLLTFSNKATTELKERIIKKLDTVNYNYNTEQLSISTIHSFCKKVIDDYSEYFINKFSATSVLNDISQGSFILSFIEDFGFRSKLDASTKVFDDFIPYFNMMADENLDSGEVYKHLKKQFYDLLKKYKKQQDSKEFDKEFNEIKNLIYFNSLYPIYLKKLVDKKYIDFSHLQKFLLIELHSNHQLLEVLQNKFQYILIDEFQDTSYLQAEIILKISDPHYKITVCGDDDQSLYRFRGATVSNFLDFPKKIPTKVSDYYLNINYRSCQNIVNRSATLIKNNNPFRIENKVIASNEKSPGIIKILKADNPTSEASDLCIIIEDLKKNKKIASYSDIAVFFRSVINDSGNFLQTLKEKQIPYKVFGIDKVETSNTLYSIIDCWRFACSYSDSLDLNSNSFIKLEEEEIAHLITNGIDSKTVKFLLKNTANEDDLFYIEHLLNLRIKLKNKEIKSNIAFFYSIANANKYFHAAVDCENKEFLSDIAYLSRIIIEIDSAYQRTDPFLISKLFNLLSLKGEDETVSLSDSGAINIMTIHQAKGLEFPVVIMPKLIQHKTRSNKFSRLNDLFHYESQDPLILQTIDERKVFYVGITRAKDHLYLSYPAQVPWGAKYHKARPLSYLSELNMNEQLIDELVIEIPNYPPIRKQREKDENDKLVLNFSKIQTYIECPRKYNFKYNLGFATVLESQLHFGSTLHKCLEKIHKNYLTNKKTEYTQPELENLIEENWIEITHRKKETKELKITALNYIFKYVLKNKSKFNQITYSEKKFSILDKVLNFEINGIMDLVKTEDNGDIIIVDFKVSKIEHPTYEKQMHLYAFAYLKAFGIAPKKMQLYSLKESEIKNVEFTKADLNEFTLFLSNTINEIRSENYNPKKGKHCSNCPYYDFCYIK